MATNADPNLERLEEAAAKLGPLLDELVVVGGCATGKERTQDVAITWRWR